MTGNMNSYKFLLGALFAVVILIFGYVRGIPDGLLHIVFCNVGQGDGIYIKLPDAGDVVIDGGPNGKILNCLGSHMAFWDRTIELVILTHPHQDHFGGLIEVVKRYKVESIVVPAIGNSDSEPYKEFIKVLEAEHADMRNLYQGDAVGLGYDIVFRSLWPDKKWIADTTGTLPSGTVLALNAKNADLNDVSEVLLFSYKNFDLLFPGDAGAGILDRLEKQGVLKKNLEILKVPHHGSSTGLDEELVSYMHPQLGIIMVGKNSYGHPSANTIRMLEKAGTMVKRTDRDGEVEITSDGERWSVK